MLYMLLGREVELILLFATDAILVVNMRDIRFIQYLSKFEETRKSVQVILKGDKDTKARPNSAEEDTVV